MRSAVLVLLLVVPGLVLAGCTDKPPAEKWPKHDLRFSGDSAFDHLEAQVLLPNGSIQYRVPGTTGNARVAQYIENELAKQGARTQFQSFSGDYACKQTTMRNVIGTFLAGAENRTIVLGAHYDTRPVSEKDPDPENRTQPVPGANDGASGVAVLLELAKALEGRINNITLVYAFFDAEDGGDLPREQFPCSTGWIMGSLEFMSRFNRTTGQRTEGVIIVDMVGDTKLELRKEKFSADGPGKPLQDRIWQTGGKLGYGRVFKTTVCCQVTDDHRAFLDAPAVDRFGKALPAVDIIHIDGGPDIFPDTHHTRADDLDHVSAKSLEIVGRTLEHVLLDLDRTPAPAVS